MTRHPSDWIPEALRFLESFDRGRTFEQFWDEYLTRYGYENPGIARPEAHPETLDAYQGLLDALQAFEPSRFGRPETDAIDPTLNGPP